MSFLKIKSEVDIAPYYESCELESFIISYGSRKWKTITPFDKIIEILTVGLNEDEYYNIIKDKRIEVTQEKAIEFINFLKSEGLLEGFENKKENKGKPMWFKKDIISPAIIERANILCMLFDKRLFSILSVLMLIWLLWFIITTPVISIANELVDLNLQTIIEVYLLSVFVTVFHELGHALALRYYGGNAGSIGVGIYFIMPVAYSDVNESWRLKPRERLIVDFGGIYFQLILSFILHIINKWFFNQNIIHYLVIFSICTILGNFIPALKFDGYWMMCDAFAVTNPWKTAKELFIEKNGSNMSSYKKTAFLFAIIVSICTNIYMIFMMVHIFLLSLHKAYVLFINYIRNPFGEITLYAVLDYFAHNIVYIITLFAGIYFFIMFLLYFAKNILHKKSK